MQAVKGQELIKDGENEYYNIQNEQVNNKDQPGGKKSKKLPKKEILRKIRCIYKIPGDRKEYLKHKGKLITVKEYKELMKAKPKKKEVEPKRKKKPNQKKLKKPSLKNEYIINKKVKIIKSL